MTLTLEPLHPQFAARARGLDLRQPLTIEQRSQINAAMNRHAVLVWPEQRLTPDQQVALAEQFGPLDIGLKRVFQRRERFAQEALIDISNLDTQGRVAGRDSAKTYSNYANQLWHSDSSFQNPRAAYSMLNAVVLPTWGGETEFADMRAAWDALPARLQQQVGDLQAEHYALHSRLLLGDESYTAQQREAIQPVQWPLVQTHAGSGRQLLFLGSHVRRIVGMPVPEGRMLVADLTEHATQPQFVYRHDWSVGDLVMWDNRATLHRGRRFDITEHRELRRTTILDVPEAELDAA